MKKLIISIGFFAFVLSAHASPIKSTGHDAHCFMETMFVTKNQNNGSQYPTRVDSTVYAIFEQLHGAVNPQLAGSMTLKRVNKNLTPNSSPEEKKLADFLESIVLDLSPRLDFNYTEFKAWDVNNVVLRLITSKFQKDFVHSVNFSKGTYGSTNDQIVIARLSERQAIMGRLNCSPKSGYDITDED